MGKCGKKKAFYFIFFRGKKSMSVCKTETKYFLSDEFSMKL